MKIPGSRLDLERRIRTLLPEQYRDTYQTIEARSMGSAALKYRSNGEVAWGEIWGSFCDLAMAGGPPHKGTLLRPGTPESIDAQPQGYNRIVAEICRGIAEAAKLNAGPSLHPGWIAVDCPDPASADWLARAVTMENVSARCEGKILFLPAGPAYRIEKEVKNVVTSIAKTCHYWFDHTSASHRAEIAELTAAMSRIAPLLQPGWNSASEDWIPAPMPSVATAIWMMRAVVACNVLARREGTTLLVARNSAIDPADARATAVLEQLSVYAL